jgi:hypothetical protein
VRHSLFVVEGPHDVEIIAALLRKHSCKRVQQFESLDPFWHRLVPTTFPHKGDLLTRVPVPTFFASELASVAIHSAIGIEKIANTLQTALDNLDEMVDSVGIVIDADHHDGASRRKELKSKLTLPGFQHKLDLGEATSSFGAGEPLVGVFVLPDNSSAGTSEDLLLSCAEVAYPNLLSAAKGLVESIDTTDPLNFRNRKENSEFLSPAGKKKATAGCVASVLKPGKAIQVSIQDNYWLRDPKALALPAVSILQDFVDRLLTGH